MDQYIEWSNHKQTRARNHEDDYFVLMDEIVEIAKLVKKLGQADKEVVWAIGKNNQNLSFNIGPLLPSWTPLFNLVCSKLILTTHTSHVTLDIGILMYAMIEKMKVDARWIIYNNIIDSLRPSKGLWFLTIITQLGIQSKVEVERNEENIKAGLAISTKASTKGPHMGVHRLGSEILEEVKEIQEKD